jgi:hypothetical protein
MKLSSSLVAALFLGGACYPKAAPPPGAPSPNAVTWASTRWPGVTAESLSRGRELFVGKCHECHDYPDLAAIADDRWPSIVKRMGGKAHLAPEESDAVLHFILASRSEQAH